MKTKKRRVNRNIKRIFLFGIISITCIVVITISLSKIVVDILDKYKEADVLANELKNLEEKEEELNDEIKKLQDSEYLARYAREKFFYSKEGEIIIRIPDNNT